MFVLLPDIVKVETCECCFLSNQVLAYKVLVIYETRLFFSFWDLVTGLN
jgi:hypothetical protein